MVEVSPPPFSGSDVGKVVLVNVVTRAQKLKDVDVQTNDAERPISIDSSKRSWKA